MVTVSGDCGEVWDCGLEALGVAASAVSIERVFRNTEKMTTNTNVRVSVANTSSANRSITLRVRRGGGGNRKAYAFLLRASKKSQPPEVFTSMFVCALNIHLGVRDVKRAFLIICTPNTSTPVRSAP